MYLQKYCLNLLQNQPNNQYGGMLTCETVVYKTRQYKKLIWTCDPLTCVFDDVVPLDRALVSCYCPVIYSLTEIETETEKEIISLTETKTETEMISKTETKYKRK